jgi:hypothetical protein
MRIGDPQITQITQIRDWDVSLSADRGGAPGRRE